MSDLHNESIFITGGGSGLGLALVERSRAPDPREDTRCSTT